MLRLKSSRRLNQAKPFILKPRPPNDLDSLHKRLFILGATLNTSSGGRGGGRFQYKCAVICA